MTKEQEKFDPGTYDGQTTEHWAGIVRGAIFCRADQGLLTEVGDEQ